MSFCKHRVLDMCKKDNRPCIFSHDCFEPEEQKPETNGDRIRAMGDEEIAEWVCKNGAIKTPCDIICGGDCKALATFYKSSMDVCKEIVMKWLQQPCEEDDHA